MKKLLVLIILLAQLPSLMAQDAVSNEEQVLCDEIDSLRNVIKDVSHNIEAMLKEVDKTKKRYEKEKKKPEVADTLQKIVYLQNTLDSLQRVVEELQRDVKDVEQEDTVVANKAEQNAVQQEYVSKLEEYANGIRAGITSKINACIRRPYLSVSMDEIIALQAEFVPYMSDPELQVPLSKLQKYKEIKEEVDKYVDVLARVYNRKDVKEASRRLSGLESNIYTGATGKPWEKVQWNEIEKIIHALDSYAPTLSAFKELIEGINKARDGWYEYSAEACADDVEALITAFDEAHLEKMRGIPYLYGKYSAYREAVLENAFHGDDVAEEILNIKMD